MPREVSVKPPAAKKPPPLGIPKWGWIAAIAIGLVVGIFVYKKSGGISTANAANGSGAGPSPLGDQSGNSGGGAVAVPPLDLSQLEAMLQAMGLRGSTTTANNSVADSSGSNLNSDSTVTSDFAPTSPDTVASGVGTSPPLITNAAAIDPTTGVATSPSTFSAQTQSPVSLATQPSNSISLATQTGTPQPSGAAAIGGARSLEMPNQQTVFVDSSGHVVSPKGTRVGGRTAES